MDKANLVGVDEPNLSSIWTEYQKMHEQIVSSRTDAKEYDELDTLHAYVSFRTEDTRKDFEKKLESINSCYNVKYYFCCCCNAFPES